MKQQLLHLFLYTFAAGSLTFGGGYALIPVVKAQFVDKLKWINVKEFGYSIAVGQITPGPITIFIAFLGWKIAGIPGALVATIGLFLPDFLAVILVTRFYEKLGNNPRVRGFFHTLPPVIGALLLSVAADLARPLFQAGLFPIVIGVISFLLMSLTSLNPGWLFLGCILSAVLFGSTRG